MIIKDQHMSGLHSASLKQWEQAGEEIAEDNAQVAVFTERPPAAARPDRWASWTPRSPREAECAVWWDRKFFELVEDYHAGTAPLTNKTFYTGKGVERPGVEATWVLLTGKAGTQYAKKTYLRIVAHMPSSVQMKAKFSTNKARVAAWRDALRGLRALILRLKKHFNPTEITASCDWNVDLGLKFWRGVINIGLRGTGAKVLKTPRGTHKHSSRAIDGFASTMRGKVSVLKKLSGFDHWRISCRFVFGRVRQKA
jgi:hypothetical protein